MLLNHPDKITQKGTLPKSPLVIPSEFWCLSATPFLYPNMVSSASSCSPFRGFSGQSPITPPSNTGLYSQPELNLSQTDTFAPKNRRLFPFEVPPARTGLALHLDALTFLYPKSADCQMLELCKKWLLVEFDFTVSYRKKVGIWWDRCFSSPSGSLYLERDTEDGIQSRLALSGTACSGSNIKILLHYLKAVYDSTPAVRCSRIDICLDDFEKRLNPDLMASALRANNYSGFASKRYTDDLEDNSGFTINLGNRQSELFVRFYNKSVESKGELDCYRWETEFKGQKAQWIFKELVNSLTVEHAFNVLRGVIFGEVQFLEKAGKNLARGKLLDWWVEWLEYINFSRIKIVLKHIKTSIEAKVMWIEHQVKKSLALVKSAYGSKAFGKFLSRILREGNDDFKRFDQLILLQYLSESLAC